MSLNLFYFSDVYVGERRARGGVGMGGWDGMGLIRMPYMLDYHFLLSPILSSLFF